jgi:hypothetical protein
MAKYLGETVLEDLTGTPYENYGPKEWAMYWISWGQIDGAHHKLWVLDQVARVLKGTPIIVKLAKWEGGEENYRIYPDDPSQEYLDWVKEMKGDFDEENGHYEYDYDIGIAP